MKATLKAQYNLLPSLFNGVELPGEDNRILFIDTLLLERGDFETVYFGEELRRAISLWFRRNKYMIDGLYESTIQKYNPIHNYDRYEESEDKSNAHSESVEKRAGYDTDVTQVAGEGTGDSTGTGSHTAHLYGNIGVTTTGAMLKEHRDVVNFAFVDAVISAFSKDLLIDIWTGGCCHECY